MKKQADPLLLDALQTDYGLRSTFFYRKLHELGVVEFSDQIGALIRLGSVYQWNERAEWSVSDSAWAQIQAAGIEPVRVFAHPLVCVQNPRLLAYYRNVAALSQKGTAQLAIATTPYENGSRLTLAHDRALLACQLFNQHVSAIIDSTLTFSRRDVDALLLASAGAQIDGSWRNAIGQEAEAVVRRLIVNGLVKQDQIAAFQNESGIIVPLAEAATDILAKLDTFRGFTLANGTALRFSSEPDVSLLVQDGKILTVIEVKGGKDKAGALERLGAAQKSFTHARRQNPDVHTIYVASVMTPEVQRRLEQARHDDQMFHEVVLLSELLAREETRTAFVTRLLQLLET